VRELVRQVLASAGVEPVLADVPEQVEVARRGDTLIIINHGEHAVRIPLPATYLDLLTGARHTESVTLARFGVAVLQSLPLQVVNSSMEKVSHA
jgi:beta-galactosidase